MDYMDHWQWCEPPEKRPEPPAPNQETLDEMAVNHFANQMCSKLAQKRAQGASGWDTCPIANLLHGLAVHIAKGDVLDIANYCMMLFERGYTHVNLTQGIGFNISGVQNVKPE